MSWRKLRRPAAAREGGFTLIEVLVGITIIAVLIGIAAAVFLGQTSKAEDSEAKQYLALAYKAVQDESAGQGKYVDADGTLAGATNLAGVIEESGVLADPQVVNSLNLDGFFVLPGERKGTSGGDQTVSAGPKAIIVDADSTANKLILYSTSKILGGGRIRECTLVADGLNVAPQIDCVAYKP